MLYYARYVDDIILIFTPQLDNSTRDYKKEVKDILSEEGLIMNESSSKTQTILLDDINRPHAYSFEYLGYKFGAKIISSKQGKLEVSISTRKKDKYVRRLLSAFDGYKLEKRLNEKKARKIFVKRLRFLMSNTRLVNNKRNVITGVYYSNSLISEVEDFKDLDAYFEKLIAESALPSKLSERIAQNSFIKGFDPSRIAKFSGHELNVIMKNWKGE